MSLPVRGAWVEMRMCAAVPAPAPCRSPCGERGLKYAAEGIYTHDDGSLPVRGAWVEMLKCPRKRLKTALSLPVRGAWVEIHHERKVTQ